MTHVYTKFGEIWLPEHTIDHGIGTGVVMSAMLQGNNADVVNYLGGTRRIPGQQNITMRGTYYNETTFLVDESGNFIVDESGNNIITGLQGDLLQHQIYQLRRQIGRWKKLYKKELQTDTLTWKNARLLHIDQNQDYAWGTIYAELDLLFETSQQRWKAETTTSSTTALSIGGNQVTVVAGGEDDIDDAVLTVTGTGTTVTSVDIRLNNADLTWSGSIPNGSSLVIDTGKKTVLLDGQSAWISNFIRSSHTLDGWLRLQPGSQDLSVTVDQACDFTVEFYDQWM